MTQEQQQLVTEHLSLVRQVAVRVGRKMPAWIGLDELESAGNVGLCEAAIRFDPEMHCSFAVFAMLRIRGAMIDAYRGRNYPRRMEGLPADAEEVLFDPSVSVETLLIEKEERVVVSVEAGKVRKTLSITEGRVLDRHLQGDSLRVIGKQEGRSGAWALYTLAEAKAKMRRGLEALDGGEKAA